MAQFLAGFINKAGNLFTKLKDAFELSNDDQMTINKIKKDELGFTHFRYQQYYKNHRVIYGEYILHQQPDSIVRTANGRLITGLKAGSTASVTEKQALDAALRFMNAGKYLWQNTDMEKELKRTEKNQQATYFPKGELVYAPDKYDGRFNPSDYRLAWYFKIYPDQSEVKAKDVYVDAVTGKVIHSTDIAMSCSGGSGTSAFNGSVNISTELNSGVYRSHNDCQATDIYVYNCNGGSASNTFYTDADNSWTATSQQSAVQAQWGAAQVYSYYNGQHSRQSWNGAAGDMIAYNNSNHPGLGRTMPAGDVLVTIPFLVWVALLRPLMTGIQMISWATSSHMVLLSPKRGWYIANESGALNESFSDIFGEMVESWSEGICDYLVGADRGAIRSFINPNNYGDPDTYKGTNWYTGTADNGGVIPTVVFRIIGFIFYQKEAAEQTTMANLIM
jgi:Zn-dependent metalloprotease